MKARQSKNWVIVRREEQWKALSQSSLPIFWSRIQMWRELSVRSLFLHRGREMPRERRGSLQEESLHWIPPVFPENLQIAQIKTQRIVRSILWREIPLEVLPKMLAQKIHRRFFHFEERFLMWRRQDLTECLATRKSRR